MSHKQKKVTKRTGANRKKVGGTTNSTKNEYLATIEEADTNRIDQKSTLDTSITDKDCKKEEYVGESSEKKEFYICMVKQIHGQLKNEAKIYVSKHPIDKIHILNSQNSYSPRINLEEEEDEEEEEKSYDENNAEERDDTKIKGDFIYSDDNVKVSKSKKKPKSKKKKSNKCTTTTTNTKNRKAHAVINEHEFTLQEHEITPNKYILWEPEMIIGKFTKREAKLYAEKWRGASRGIESRRNRGILLFNDAVLVDKTLKCYDKRIIPIVPDLDTWLKSVNLSEYILPQTYMTKFFNIINTISHLSDSETQVVSIEYKKESVYVSN